MFQVVDEGNYKHIMLTDPELLKVIGELSASISLRSFMFQMVDEGDDKGCWSFRDLPFRDPYTFAT